MMEIVFFVFLSAFVSCNDLSTSTTGIAGMNDKAYGKPITDFGESYKRLAVVKPVVTETNRLLTAIVGLESVAKQLVSQFVAHTTRLEWELSHIAPGNMTVTQVTIIIANMSDIALNIEQQLQQLLNRSAHLCANSMDQLKFAHRRVAIAAKVFAFSCLDFAQSIYFLNKPTTCLFAYNYPMKVFETNRQNVSHSLKRVEDMFINDTRGKGLDDDITGPSISRH